MYTAEKADAVELCGIVTAHLEQYLKQCPPKVKNWLNKTGFEAKSGQLCYLPGRNGQVEKVFLGLSSLNDAKAYAMAASHLPKGRYYSRSKMSYMSYLNWGLSQYRFDRYKSMDSKVNELVLPKTILKETRAMVEATFMVRDLINTPAEDMGPEQLSEQMKALAKTHDADFKEIVDDELLEQNYPAIHVVGRAATSRPRLLELSWGDKKNPTIVLVGKGVCFDSGGLDIKPASGMRQMKKDMGGAAHVIGLASLIMSMKLPIRLHVLVPAVENAISGNAYRPGDIVKTRSGLTVEIGNTDAEGRVILADALTRASELKPKVIIDFATLTGAARVAVGLELAAMFTNHDKFAEALTRGSEISRDPIWRLPLYQPYLSLIQPSIADLSNSGSTPYGGAITAALFLQQFVAKKIPWVHFDIMAANLSGSPGRPAGGEAMGLRAVYMMLKNRFGKKVTKKNKA